jgi:hypothetical protein
VQSADGQQALDVACPQMESVSKRQILEKLSRRMKEIEKGEAAADDSCPELNPDIIVISADHSLLFEPQNLRASELLRMRCGLSIESVHGRDRIRVHPCKGQKIIADLRAAGLKVVC